MIGVGDTEYHLRRHERRSTSGSTRRVRLPRCPAAPLGTRPVRPARCLELHQTEVEHLGKVERRARSANHHVRRLDVAMHQTVDVRVLER